MSILLTTLNAKYVHSSLALRNLAAFCSLNEIEVSIKEYTINQHLPHILSDIYRRQPQIVGIACYIWNMRQVKELCGLIKKVMPDVTLILGGPEVSYDAEAVFRSTPADYIIQGEGEQALTNLLSCLKSGSWQPIPGVACRNPEQLSINECQVVDKLDEIPFAYKNDQLQELRDRIIYYESSRGCPFSCQYCLSSATSGVRFYSLSRVLSDLQKFIDADVKQVKFVDRTFNTKKDHYLPILQFLAKQNCRTNFHFEIAADLLDDEAISILTAAPVGRFQLEIGIQSVYEPTLQAICRKNDWQLIQKSVAKLREADLIHLHLDLIVGLPYESKDMFARSFNAVYSLQPHMLQIGFLKLLKGSGIRKNAESHGYVYTEEAPYEVLANSYMAYSEIREMHIIEDVFNLTYNSGRFTATLRFLVDDLHNKDAFKLFALLAEYWERLEMDMVSHAPKAIYSFIYSFCVSYYPRLADTILVFLKFDSLCHDDKKVRPEFLPWNDKPTKDSINRFWHDEDLVKTYLPDFHFTSWREVNQNYHIEYFSIDVSYYLETGEILRQDTMLLFDFRQPKPVYRRISLKGVNEDAL